MPRGTCHNRGAPVTTPASPLANLARWRNCAERGWGGDEAPRCCDRCPGHLPRPRPQVLIKVMVIVKVVVPVAMVIWWR